MTHNSLRISTFIPRTWRVLLFRSTLIEIDRYDGVLHLNEHGYLYNFGVHIILLKIIIRRKLSEGKKDDIAKNVHRAPYPGM